MAHGYINSRLFRPGDVVTLEDFFSKNYHSFGKVKPHVFWRNQKFIWEIYNDVAKAHGITLPRFWVCANKLQPGRQYQKRFKSEVNLEPLGPTIDINMSFDTNSLFSAAANYRSTLFDYNWYKLAESLLDVVPNSVHRNYVPGLLCEKWRVVK